MLYAICMLCAVYWVLCTGYAKDERWRFWEKRKVVVVGLGRDGRERYSWFCHFFFLRRIDTSILFWVLGWGVGGDPPFRARRR